MRVALAPQSGQGEVESREITVTVSAVAPASIRSISRPVGNSSNAAPSMRAVLQGSDHTPAQRGALEDSCLYPSDQYSSPIMSMTYGMRNEIAGSGRREAPARLCHEEFAF